MKFLNQSILFMSALMFLSWGTLAQQFKGNAGLWSEIGEKNIPKVGTRYLTPHKYRTLKLNLATLREILNVAPMEFTPVAQMTKTYIELPMPDGRMMTFDIVESPIMAPELAEKFPEITTYAGFGVENKGSYVRFDLTPQGFHAIIFLPGEGTVFIDPYSFGGGDIAHYTVYNRKDYASSVLKIAECNVTDTYDHSRSIPPPDLKTAYGSCELRTYRLALAATGEYTTFHGGTVALAQAAQVTTMNRINGVYEREMSIRMNIVANNNLIIYTNSATDPYTNNNGGTMLGQNQTNCNAVIGSANYDIGHVFSTGGGGIAQLGCVCTANKARGVTGSGAPIGDAFDIDYVAHEMGHQFACNHTFNNNSSGSCTGNANTATSMEPGSGSTIMAYAGICGGGFDMQPNSDDYFHTISLQEMGAFITGGGHTCPVKTPLANSNPAVTVASATVNIPRSTPFSLTATGTDPNPTNVLTYCWEQMDAGISTTTPIATQTTKNNFRTFDPVTSPTRYFPNLTSLASNGPFTWEVLPSVARTMNFRVTVRDNAPGGGCTQFANVAVAVDGGSGPFEVTYPNATGISWAGNSTQTVTWNVANSTNAPVSCANVDIYISTNGGASYTLLLANTPNDGTQSITAPNTPSTTCRIMVRCSNGYFFDISNNNFTITAATNDYTLSVTNTTVAVCQPSSAVYNINVGSIGGYSSAVTLSLTGLPAGATQNFSTNPVTPVGTSNLTIGNIAGVAPGTYSMTLTATSASGTKNIDLTLIVSSTAPTAPTLTTPANAAIGQNNPVGFTWSLVSGAGVSYIIQISTNASFTGIVETDTVTVNNYTSVSTLTSGATYYWRIIAVTGCGTAPASSTFSFTMSTCNTYTSTNVPLTISGTGIQTVNSIVAVPLTGTITDVNVTNLVGTHTYMSDLIFKLSSPTVPNIVLFRNICTNLANWNIKFDQAAASATLPCPPTDGNYYRPFGNLNAFNGANPNGTWTLNIIDSFDVDGGSLTAWAIQVCIATPSFCAIAATTSAQTNVACFGNNTGSVTVTGSGAVAPYAYQWSNSRTTATNTGLAEGIYTVTVTDANSCSTTQSVTITQPSSALNPTLSNPVNAACFGASTGSISLTTGGTGTGPYTFLWSNGRTTQNNTGLPAGPYTVTVTDANGCTVSRNTTITQPASALNGSSSLTNATCSVAGSINLTVSGGNNGNYSYLWSNSAVTQDLNGLGAGSYTVTITDAGGCTITNGPNTITSVGTPSASIVNTNNILCNGVSNGSVDINVVGGTGPYTYLWSNSRTTEDVSGLAAGTYSVTVTDAISCITSIGTINITQPALITASGISSNVSCNGAANGAINITVNGGTSGYNFNWGAGLATEDISGLSAGNYTVTITDANNCVATQSFTVTQPTVLSASASSTGVSCAGNDGTANTTINGGTAPYTVNWNNGATGIALSGLAAGNYSTTVTDFNGCISSVSVTVSNLCTSCSISATASSANLSCFAACNGSATATPTSGTAPYSYSWSDAGTGAVRNNFCSGNYTVTITDNAGCTNVQTVTIGQPAALSANASSSYNACTAASGNASVTIVGGTSPYSYLWNNGATSQNLNNLSGGTYFVTATDASGCTISTSASVVEPGLLDATSTVGNPTTANDGTIDISLTGGTAPYSYNWSNGATTQDLLSLGAGTYTVTVTDANGCITTETATLIVVGIEDIESVQNFLVVPNPSNGQFQIQVDLSAAQDLTIQLVDVLGRTLLEWNVSQQTQVRIPVEISEQAGGMYLVVLRSNNGEIQTRKVSISK